jgi:uncharacterized membrane protein (DUF106 family)
MVIELVQEYPKVGIVIFAGVLSLFISIVNYFVMDKTKVRELRVKQKDLQLRIKEEKDQTKKMELTNDMMKHSMETLRHSFKPMLITLIPVLLFFSYIKGVFDETSIAGSWFWYYLVAAILWSFVFRKLFKLP